MKQLKAIQLLVLTLTSSSQILFGQQILKPAAVFGDNMVIQRNVHAPVWGTAAPGEEITIRFAGFTVTAVTDSAGKWRTHLPVLEAGGPYTMEISNESNVKKFKNVMVGEVWLASGQSNMRLPLEKSMRGAAAIAEASYKNIRYFDVRQDVSRNPLEDLPPAKWQICTPHTAGHFSGVAYFFARELHIDKNIPVGIIHSTWDGTAIETWISGEALATHPDFTEKMSFIKNSSADWSAEQKKSYENSTQREEIFESRPQHLTRGLLGLNYDDSYWPKEEYPISFYNLKLPPYCIVWLRKKIDIPEKIKTDVRLKLGTMYEWDETFINGEKVGSTRWLHDRVYTVPSKLLKQGENIISIRMLSEYSAGRLGESKDEPVLETTDQSIVHSLKGPWSYNYTIEPALPSGTAYQNEPSALYNAMIAPVVSYGIRGVIWYQGEANEWKPQQYKTLQPLLLRDWRQRWDLGDIPFLIVQLANFNTEANWAFIREAQTEILKYPNTGMAVAIDVGESHDIHPKQKEPVGKRLYLWARHVAYGEEGFEYSGPLYESMQIEGNKIRIRFDHATGGLTTKNHEPVKGFTIADASRNFHPAIANIDGEQIIVYSEEVDNPVAIRYGWTSDPTCNLYNQEELPASPFRTDNWSDR